MGVKSWPVGSPRLRWFPDAYPREARERYRIYRYSGGGPAEVVCTTPTAEGIGTALVTLHAEGEFEGCRVGVLDVLAEKDRWIISPYETGGS